MTKRGGVQAFWASVERSPKPTSPANPDWGPQMDPSVRAKSGSRHGTEVRRDGFQCNRAFQIVDVVFGKFVLFGTGYDAI